MEKKINKTKIEKRLKGKTNLELVETIIKLKKTNPVAAKELARPMRIWASVNLDKISKVKGDVLILGKVLSNGKLDAPKKIVSWKASENAMKKISTGKGTFVSIVDEMVKNPELKGLEIVK